MQPDANGFTAPLDLSRRWFPFDFASRQTDPASVTDSPHDPRAHRRPPHDRWFRLAALSTLAAGACATMAINWPGHLSYNSVVQLAEARSGRYEGWHPPVMSWLLGIGNSILPGAALFACFDTVLIFGALAILAAMGRKPGWPLVAAACAILTLPQALIYPAVVWKDVLFAGSATAGFACLAQAAAWWTKPARRAAMLGAAALLIALAALARQNGAVILPFSAAAVAWISHVERGGATSPRRAVSHGLAFLLFCGLLLAAGASALATRTIGHGVSRNQWAMLQTYDLAGALSIDPSYPLPVLKAQSPDLERQLRQSARTYTPARADPLTPVLDRLKVDAASAGQMREEWRDLIIHYLPLYLRTRARAFLAVFLTPEADGCLMAATGVDGDPRQLARAGLAVREDPRDDALGDYAAGLRGTPLFSHAAYALVELAGLVFLLRRRRASDVAVAAMIASAMSFTASFALISVGCDYRYLYDLDLSVIAAVIHIVATWRDGPGQAGRRSAVCTDGAGR